MPVHGAPEMSIGLDLDWNRIIRNFVEFGLEPDCKTLSQFGILTGFGLKAASHRIR